MLLGVCFLCPTWAYAIALSGPVPQARCISDGLCLSWLRAAVGVSATPRIPHHPQLLQLLISREYNPQKALAKELECDHHWLPVFLDNNIPTF